MIDIGRILSINSHGIIVAQDTNKNKNIKRTFAGHDNNS